MHARRGLRMREPVGGCIERTVARGEGKLTTPSPGTPSSGSKWPCSGIGALSITVERFVRLFSLPANGTPYPKQSSQSLSQPWPHGADRVRVGLPHSLASPRRRRLRTDRPRDGVHYARAADRLDQRLLLEFARGLGVDLRSTVPAIAARSATSRRTRAEGGSCSGMGCSSGPKRLGAATSGVAQRMGYQNVVELLNVDRTACILVENLHQNRQVASPKLDADFAQAAAIAQNGRQVAHRQASDAMRSLSPLAACRDAWRA